MTYKSTTGILIAFFFVLMQPVFSANTEKTDIKNIAKGWLKTSPAYLRAEQAKKPFKTLDDVIEVTDPENGEIVAYAVNLEPAGFVIVSPDERINPVIAYSTESRFDAVEDEENTLLLLLRKDIPERKKALEAGVVPQDKINRSINKRGALAAAGAGTAIGLQKTGPIQMMYDVEFGPFLTSVWGQSHDGWGHAVFNYYTPPNASGSVSNYVCGCVATAMAQVLYYYQWPLTGSGTYSYTWNNGSDPARVLSADFGSTTYDWANMLDRYHYVSTTEAQRQAAGLLSSHCGIAVDMDYSSEGSGASVLDVESALEDHFRMSAEFIDSTATFLDRMYDNMITNRPTLLGIIGPEGGHCIVVDGVRHDTGNEPYFHINLGWYGSGYNGSDPDNADGWYSLEEPIVTSSYTFYYMPGAVVDIVPAPFLNDITDVSDGPDIGLNWSVSGHLDADSYEVQYARFPDGLSSFTDPVNDMNHWQSSGHWEIATTRFSSSPYSLHGYFEKTEDERMWFTELRFDEAVQIHSSTTIQYYWATWYFSNTEARLEISLDGEDWATLKTYTAFSQTPVSETVTSAELSPYHGEAVSFRWVIEFLGGVYYPEEEVGFYFDDFTINDAYIQDWTVADNTLIDENHDFSLPRNGNYIFRVRAFTDSEWQRWANFETVTVNALELRARVMLEGAYDTGTGEMTTDLELAGIVPQDSPYTEAPAFCELVPDSITDWVLVELRSDAEGPVVEYRSALLSENGFLCGTDGTQGVLFSADDGDYYLIIHHRNHLPVMSADRISFIR